MGLVNAKTFISFEDICEQYSESASPEEQKVKKAFEFMHRDIQQHDGVLITCTSGAIESEDILSVGGFDVVYTDTFSESYEGMSLDRIIACDWRS